MGDSDVDGGVVDPRYLAPVPVKKRRTPVASLLADISSKKSTNTKHHSTHYSIAQQDHDQEESGSAQKKEKPSHLAELQRKLSIFLRDCIPHSETL